ncbi:hypothetical protein ACQEVZ_08115 [Dactylosporangium sp. CA-152071]|uniref:hypothetical protein n=1 Tax=Dactylosporangium sp. CA-152071 TaxID=3239933 RepID=UPI003D91829D
MGRWWVLWPARAGLTFLLLLSLLLAPLASAQSAHLLQGHPDGHAASAGHGHHGVTGEHSHQHHHNVLHTAGAPAYPQQPKLPTGSATVITVPAGVVTEPPPPPAVPDRDTGQPRQSHLQVWRI